MSARPIATTRAASGIPTGRLAVWWILASEVVIFGGLLASYVMHRLAHDAWSAHAAHTNVYIGTFNTFVLLTSSLSAVLAHKAVDEGNYQKAAKLIVATMGGGMLFATVKYFEWNMEIDAGYTILTNTFWSFYYTAAGLHAAHVIAGVIIMGFVAKDCWKGRETHRVELIGIYWHFVDIVWIFLFPLLYIAK